MANREGLPGPHTLAVPKHRPCNNSRALTLQTAPHLLASQRLHAALPPLALSTSSALAFPFNYIVLLFHVPPLSTFSTHTPAPLMTGPMPALLGQPLRLHRDT